MTTVEWLALIALALAKGKCRSTMSFSFITPNVKVFSSFLLFSFTCFASGSCSWHVRIQTWL